MTGCAPRRDVKKSAYACKDCARPTAVLRRAAVREHAARTDVSLFDRVTRRYRELDRHQDFTKVAPHHRKGKKEEDDACVEARRLLASRATANDGPGLLIGLILARDGTGEGCKSVAYKDAGRKVPTVCFGHTGPDVRVGDVKTAHECVDLLNEDIEPRWDAVDRLVKVPLTAHQKAALVSFAYNVGLANFKKSTLLKLINKGKLKEGSQELKKWIRAGDKVLPGLVKRRARELEHFNTSEPSPDAPSQEPLPTLPEQTPLPLRLGQLVIA